MTAPSLDDSWAKLRWAESHYEILRGQIEPFQQRNDHRVTVDIDANSGEYVFHVVDLPEIPDAEWGLRIGDVVHNAWSALDYLVVQLWAHVTGEDPRTVTGLQFPVYTDPARFNGKGNLGQSIVKLRGEPAFSGYLARLEELQPFNQSNPSIWGAHPIRGMRRFAALPAALERLSDMNNVDKHRVIHAVWHGLAWQRQPAIPIPAGYQLLSMDTRMGALGDDTYVSTCRFQTPLPEPLWQPDQVTMQRRFPLQVCVDVAAPTSAVLEILPMTLWGVRSALQIFEPVFTHGAPPLPVTAIPEP